MPSQPDGLYYRCYFTKNDHIVAVEAVFAADDDGAIERARTLLAAAEFLSMELWRGAECVAKLDKDVLEPPTEEVLDNRT
jgi:hypothetical protein